MTNGPRALAVSVLLVASCAHRSWNEIHAGFGQASSRDCLACHEQSRPLVQAHRSHAIDADYAEAAARPGASLRPLADVRGRGIAVPDGKVGCRSCHAADSPWKDHLAIPTGAVVRPAVDPRDPRTYADEAGRSGPPERSSAVSPKPLCEACHAF